ncbi:MAG: glutamine-hydrolyzing carbamoyl-phosphate synthase small subunit [Acidobacteria bacterium]|nr:glutamine-hydrolyzing carbamoyl-phosphate synthase small subunit [Acidobacteriota bacterium]
MKAILALENGTWYEGTAAGALGETGGEVVFNTSMTGYQEVLTDPSYAGQIVTMTCPHIGNYGVAPGDTESGTPKVAGFIMREPSPIASNWRASGSLRDYLVQHNIVAIGEIDTRALTRLLRSGGVMRGVIATGQGDPADLIEKARTIPSMEGSDLVSGVTTAQAFDWPAAPPAASDPTVSELLLPPQKQASRLLAVAAYDYGLKWNILRRLAAYGCQIRVFPATTPASDLLATQPDGVFLSNGPGDPAALPYAIENVRGILNANLPVFGICLGHQLMALAMGAQTFKLKFGHRGANHPVKQLDTGHVEITSQNHGFAVAPDTLPSDVKVTHLNLYDGTLEGFRHRTRPIFCVQYHPEASPGPHDADYLFREFIDAMESR